MTGFLSTALVFKPLLRQGAESFHRSEVMMGNAQTPQQQLERSLGHCLTFTEVTGSVRRGG